MVSMNWFHRTDWNFLFLATTTSRAVSSVRPMMRIVQNAPAFPLRSPKKAQNRNADDAIISTTDIRRTSARIVITDKLYVCVTTRSRAAETGSAEPEAAHRGPQRISRSRIRQNS